MFLRERIPDGSKYLYDRSTFKGHARNVILPNDETELREGIRYSSKGNTKVTISGTRMGAFGGAVPTGGDVMSMERMYGVIGAGKDENGIFLRVLPNTTVSLFNNAISSGKVPGLDDCCAPDMTGLVFPVKADVNQSVGGCVSVNRSGIREYVRRIKVVFSDSTFMTIQRGEYIADGRRMCFPSGRNYFSFDLPEYDSDDSFGPKISENMDLIDLIIGSEGIFCIITEADIYLSADVKESSVQECGKTTNGLIRERYGQEAEDSVRRIKEILDTNYILNIGNLL